MTQWLIRIISRLTLGSFVMLLLAIGTGYNLNLVDNELIFSAYSEISGSTGFDIFRMDIAHGLILRLTTIEANSPQVNWSPDGQQISFIRSHAGNKSAIYVMDIQGKNLQLLTDVDKITYNFVWSPDGRSILFTDTVTSEIYVKDLASGVTHLTNNQTKAFNPSWSPDSRQIVFSSDMTTLNNADIFRLDVQTGEVHPFVATPAKDTDPVWSPDGRYLLYLVDEAQLNAKLHLMLYDTQNDRTTQLFIDNFFVAFAPNWSPDGQFIVYTAFTAYDSISLFRINIVECLQKPKTCSPQRLTYTPKFYFSPRWRPRPS